MKKIIAALILGSLSSLSFAQATQVELCAGGTAIPKDVKAKTAPEAGAADERFIKTNFKFNCSNNSFVVYTEQSATVLTVGATSAKGSEYFGGHTDGGAVKSYGTCADSKACVAADAEAGDAEAKKDAEADGGGGAGGGAGDGAGDGS